MGRADRGLGSLLSEEGGLWVAWVVEKGLWAACGPGYLLVLGAGKSCTFAALGTWSHPSLSTAMGWSCVQPACRPSHQH